MNELCLSGTILTLVKTPTTGDTSHVVCQLRHSHRNRQQQVIHGFVGWKMVILLRWESVKWRQ